MKTRRFLREKKRRSQKKKHVKHVQRCVEISLEKRVAIAKTYIRNISKLRLTTDDILLLSRGLGFVPTPIIRRNQIMSDFNGLIRDMRRTEYFSTGTTDLGIKHPFHTKSLFIPPLGSNATEDYKFATQLELTTSKTPHHWGNNLSKGERESLEKLRSKNLDIIITKADKNSTTVIMDKDIYMSEAYAQLYDGIHYTEIDAVDIKRTQRLVMDLVCRLSNENILDRYTLKYLYEPLSKKDIPHLYLLPKIHKIKQLLEDLDPVQPIETSEIKVPGRPIISQCNSPTERLGKYLDYFLIPIVREQNTYLSDTAHFINEVEKVFVPSNSLLVTYDITSLYTNLSFDEIADALEKDLSAHGDIEYGLKRPPINLLVEIAQLILRQNEFTFNGKFFRQIVGAPMGAIPSPELCDIAIFRHINQLLKCFPQVGNILFHKRFRDDGYIIYDGPIEDITNFFIMANNAHPLLKFTYETSDTEIAFLDTVSFKGPRFETSSRLDIKCHTKPTETYQYLHRDSAHPPSCFKSFIKGETMRYVRNCNNYNDFKEKTDNFKSKLKLRGYGTQEINAHTADTDHTDRPKLLIRQLTRPKKSCQQEKPLRFITTFHPMARHLSRILGKYWHIINNDRAASKLFPCRPVNVFRRGKNLKELLCKSKI